MKDAGRTQPAVRALTPVRVARKMWAGPPGWRGVLSSGGASRRPVGSIRAPRSTKRAGLSPWRHRPRRGSRNPCRHCGSSSAAPYSARAQAAARPRTQRPRRHCSRRSKGRHSCPASQWRPCSHPCTGRVQQRSPPRPADSRRPNRRRRMSRWRALPRPAPCRCRRNLRSSNC